MGAKLNSLVKQIRTTRGSFFVARLHLRVRFPLDDQNLPDKEEYMREVVEACHDMGFDISSILKTNK